MHSLPQQSSAQDGTIIWSIFEDYIWNFVPDCTTGIKTLLCEYVKYIIYHNMVFQNRQNKPIKTKKKQNYERTQKTK